MQEKFRNMISYYPQILQTSARVLQAAKVLEMPIIVTEQYPKALGKTCSELEISELPVFAKTNFNMLQPDVEEYFKSFKDKPMLKIHYVMTLNATQLLINKYAVVCILLEQMYN
ncbi:ISOC2 [Bugula neritina]|uniref:ISOC2 n=1 Tax=Bugula neritina TaxID=10212 RepID=A0A7J7K0U1_BUGNE|nr:ISOC2 [Bugula neritina]